jgi:hypothetical protein
MRHIRLTPEEVVDSLEQSGFHEYKREIARTGHDHDAGGLWLGLDADSGSVASVIWVASDDEREPALVFVEVDGHPLNVAA